MSKLLIVDESVIVRAIFKELLDESGDFNYDLAGTYDEAKILLASSRYEYGVVDRVLKDAPRGEIIALFNKHNIAPLVFTNEIDEDFFESFEGAQIVGYMKKIDYDNEAFVLNKLKQLKKNKRVTVLIVSKSGIYSSYLKQNLNLHSFKVFSASTNEEAYEKLNLHPEISLMIVDPVEDEHASINLINYARTLHASKKLKIIVLAEETNSYITSSLLKCGADDYLVKQFSRDEFYIRVYQNLNSIELD